MELKEKERTVLQRYESIFERMERERESFAVASLFLFEIGIGSI